MSIRVLDDALINQIAAGEVVERPASVVKELVENAVDAGATRITLSLREGGRDLIHVLDNGSGMNPTDAKLCLRRHATSKIKQFSDLVHIETLGFRGEALPSIASVSRFSLLTRTKHSDEGVQVSLTHSGEVELQPVGCAIGTEIRVADLFHSVPARRSFLRSAITELNHCVDQLRRQALIQPQIDFTLKHNGKVVLRAPAVDSLQERIQTLLGADAFRLFPVNFESNGVRIDGWVSAPDRTQSTHAAASFHYINARFVRDPVLRRAVAAAYRGRVEKGRHPITVLNLHIAPERVDVNAHPGKTEVRFRDPTEVSDVITDALVHVLERTIPSASPGPLWEAEPLAPPSLTAHPDECTIPASPKLPLPSTPLTEDPIPTFDAAPSPSEDTFQRFPASKLLNTPTEDDATPDAHRISNLTGPPNTLAEPSSAFEPPHPARTIRWIGLLDERYLLTEREGALVVIDSKGAQRARVIHQTMQRRTPIRISPPIPVQLDRSCVMQLLDKQEDLEKVGLCVRPFNASALLITAVPPAVAPEMLSIDWSLLLSAHVKQQFSDLWSHLNIALEVYRLDAYDARTLLADLNEAQLLRDDSPFIALINPETLWRR